MKQTYQWVLIAASTSALFACGSSGSGSGVTAPVKPPVIVEQHASGVANLANGQYTYKAANGKEYDFTMPGLTVGGVINANSNTNSAGLSTGDASFIIGGTAYTSMRFGAYASADGTRDVFVAGTPTLATAVPATGIASYGGLAVRSLGVDTSGSFAMDYMVDFANKTISGTGSTADEPMATFGPRLELSGTISGSSISGEAKSGGETGAFTGNFFGPAAEELAGTANFANWKLDAAFGGRKK